MDQIVGRYRNNCCSRINVHIQTILKSGILVDEDMDCVFSYYRADDETTSEITYSLVQKIVGGISLASTIFSLQRKLPVLYVPISASPLLFEGFRRLHLMLSNRKQKRRIEVLVQAVVDTSKMNRMITEYFRTRAICNPITFDVISPFTPIMKQLMELVMTEEVKLLHRFISFVNKFATYVPPLKTGYFYLNHIEMNQFNINNIHSVTDCVTYLEKLCDIYVLVVSNTLTCLAVTLCSNVSTEFNINVDHILDNIVPEMKSLAVSCYNKVNKKFDDVKYYYLNRKRIQKPPKQPPSKLSKLRYGTYSILSHTSEILEKSMIIYNRLNHGSNETLAEKQLMSACIGELRNQAFDYFESLDILHKLYEVEMNKSVPPFKIPTDSSSDTSTQPPKIIEVEDASFNNTEPTDDEVYEMFIGDKDTSNDVTSISFYEEQESRKLASMLGREIKQKLKTDSRFIAARQKRGLTDEDEKKEVSAKTLPDFRPCAPLTKSPPMSVPNCDDFNNKRLLPPPPPPPLPPLDLGPYGDGIRTPCPPSVNHLLEAIKVLSGNRPSHVDVFESEATGGD